MPFAKFTSSFSLCVHICVSVCAYRFALLVLCSFRFSFSLSFFLFFYSCKMCGILIECLHFIKLTMVTINTVAVVFRTLFFFFVSALIQLGHANYTCIFLRLNIKRSEMRKKKYLAQRLPVDSCLIGVTADNCTK